VQLTLNRTGDLLYWMYVLIDIPAIQAIEGCGNGFGNNNFGNRGVNTMNFPWAKVCDPCNDGRQRRRGDDDFGDDSASRFSDNTNNTDDSDRRDDDDDCGCKRPWANWVDEIGFAALVRTAFSIGGQVIDTLYSHFLHMWEELTGQAGKRLEEMIGKAYSREELVEMSKHPRRLYVPLPFYFTRHSGNAFPLVSVQFHQFQVHVHFACLQNLIQVSDCNTIVVRCDNGQPLTSQDMHAYLDTTYVYLDKEERDRFALGSFQQLITQVQYFCTSGNGSEQITAQINFNHPQLEVIWAVQRQCQVAANNTFNYSGAWCRDPIRRARLLVNNQSRFDREAEYFRMVQPYQAHTNIPRGFIYVYSFALHPEDCQPSGTLNFSRIDNVEFSVRLQEAIASTNVSLIFIGRNFNVLRFKEGLGGVLFG
jgi:hypothetical protein